MVSVSGSLFVDNQQLQCLFGSTAVPARFIVRTGMHNFVPCLTFCQSNSSISCNTPPLAPSTVPFAVSQNSGASWTPSSYGTFTFRAAPVITSVSPLSGKCCNVATSSCIPHTILVGLPGTVITIDGQNFVPGSDLFVQLVSRSGLLGQSQPAYPLLSCSVTIVSTEVQCFVSPSTVSGVYTVQISNDGGYQWTSSGQAFTRSVWSFLLRYVQC